jgi:thioredoxin 1
MATIKSTDDTFDTLLKENKNLLIDFWAPWCGPCTSIATILEEISDEMKEVTIVKHCIDDEPNLPTKYGVRGIPTMLLFSNGELKATKVGATSKTDLVSWLKDNI